MGSQSRIEIFNKINEALWLAASYSDRQHQVLRNCDSSDWQRLCTGNGLVAEQTGGELSPFVLTMGTRNAWIPAQTNFAEIRRRLGLCP